MGNQLKKEYEVNLDAQCASGGLGLRWKLFKAIDLKTKEEVTIFTFSKKDLPKTLRKEADRIINILKKEVERGYKFKHPNCLRVIKPIKEFRGELAFVTERVDCSLSNILGDVGNESVFKLPSNIANFKFGALQLRSGIAQLCDACLFIHNDAHMAHSFIDPCNIYITASGDWKLFGFEFAQHVATQDDEAGLDWDYTNNKELAYYPSFDCLAPEIMISNIVTIKSDVFSVGRLLYILHRQQSGIRRENVMKSADEYRRFINDLNIALLHKKGIPFEGIPATLIETLKRTLTTDEKLRCNVSDIVNCKYLNDMIVRVIRYLEKILEKEEDGKIKFLKRLPQVISMFDKQTLIHKVIPPLMIQIKDERMLNYIMPSLMKITEVLTNEEYQLLIEPQLCRYFISKDLPQVFYLLCDNIMLLCGKSTIESRRDKLTPMILLGLGVRNVAIQRNILKSIPNLVEKSYIEWKDLKNRILPKLKAICNLNVGENSKITPLRVNALMCLAKIFHKFDSETITAVILKECVWRILDKTKETAILMSVLGCADAIAKHVNPHIIAHNILPNIIPLLMEENLNMKQYSTFIKCTRYMIDKCDRYRVNQINQTGSNNDKTPKSLTDNAPIKESMNDILEKEFDPRQKGELHKKIDDPFASPISATAEEKEENTVVPLNIPLNVAQNNNNDDDMFMSLGNNYNMDDTNINGGKIDPVNNNNNPFGGFGNESSAKQAAAPPVYGTKSAIIPATNDQTEAFGWNVDNDTQQETTLFDAAAATYIDNTPSQSFTVAPFAPATKEAPAAATNAHKAITTHTKRRVRTKGSIKPSKPHKKKESHTFMSFDTNNNDDTNASYVGFGSQPIQPKKSEALSAFGFMNDTNEKQQTQTKASVMFGGKVESDMFSGMGIKSGDVFAGLGHKQAAKAKAAASVNRNDNNNNNAKSGFGFMNDTKNNNDTQSLFASSDNNSNQKNTNNTDDIFAGLF